MVRKAALIGIALAALAPLVFATATEEQSSGQEEANLRFVIWDEHQLAMQQQLASEFMAMNPHIMIDIDVIPWADYWTAVQTAVAGGDAHDVLWMNGPNLALFASNGILLPISDRIDRDGYDLSAYPQSLVDLYTHDGMLYGLSKDFDTIGLYYNVEMFDAAGLDYPDDTWTWDDLKNAARALTTDDVWGFAATLWAQMVVFDLIGQNGGQVLSDDGMHVLYGTPEACEALQFLYSFHEEGLSPDQVTLDTTNQWDLFSSQRVAMMYEGSWLARAWADLEFPVNVAPLPVGKQRSNIIHGLAYVIVESTEHPEQAWEFVKYLGSEEAHIIQSSMGAVISSRAGTQQLWVDSFGDEMDVQVLLDEVPYAKPFPVARAPLAWEDEAKQVLLDAFRGNLSFPEACAMAAEAGDAYIADNLVN